MDAVYAMARAYHQLMIDKCGNITLCAAIRPIPSGELMLKYIRNVTFIGQSLNNIARVYPECHLYRSVFE